VSYDAGHVTALIKELLALNQAERAPTPDPASAEQLEYWKTERRRIRQELVRVLSGRVFRPELLVVENDIQQ
jgi:hypothetical protein